MTYSQSATEITKKIKNDMATRYDLSGSCSWASCTTGGPSMSRQSLMMESSAWPLVKTSTWLGPPDMKDTSSSKYSCRDRKNRLMSHLFYTRQYLACRYSEACSICPVWSTCSCFCACAHQFASLKQGSLQRSPHWHDSGDHICISENKTWPG